MPALKRTTSVAAGPVALWRTYRGILIPVSAFLVLAFGWAFAVKVTEIPPNPVAEPGCGL